ncbi:FixH family protein [Pseudohongiella spirulinae]|uniref:Auxin-binding protein n=1 Tax=Pseudohongiella spirulinae TaxID=1249552 RepID=A0A0S2KGR9_9GAMM|nr:FixH family protein [Pseudohongiella spirulinae]ALO47482.1 Auxin-binding protein [Pseudohongiella spirulinae]
MRTPDIIAIWLVLLSLCSPTLLARELLAESQPPGLIINMQSQLQPLTINQMHSWIITIRDTDNRPVAGATIEVNGGMAEHDHGLATAPRVTDYLGDGAYLLQGMRFHMPGQWQLELTILVETARYSASMTVDL